MRASISNTCDHKQTFNRNDIMSHTTEMAPYAPLWVVIKTHYYLDSCNYPNSKVYTLGGVDHDVSTSTTSAGVLPAPMKDRRNRLLRTEPHRPQRQYTTLKFTIRASFHWLLRVAPLQCTVTSWSPHGWEDHTHARLHVNKAAGMVPASTTTPLKRKQTLETKPHQPQQQRRATLM